MRNDELFRPDCPVKGVKELVKAYVLRGLADSSGAYMEDQLLARQHAIYEGWLTAMRERFPKFECGFYEWLGRRCDAAFVFQPGNLVKFDGRYCMVVRRRTHEVTWTTEWRLRRGAPTVVAWPREVRSVELKDPSGNVFIVDALCASIEPSDIPPEVFALACGRAKDCPMMKGGAE